MKKVIVAGLSWCLFSSQLLGKEVLLDRISAVVGTEPILESEVQDKIKNGPLVEFSDVGSAGVEAKDNYTKALNDLINGKIILQKAKELDIQVKEDQIDNQISQILADSHSTLEQLKAYLKEHNKDFSQYRKELRDRMVFSRFKGRLIIPNVKISDRDLEVYFLKKNGSTPDSAEFGLKRILIPVENETLLREKEKFANEVYDKLRSGLSFEEAQTFVGGQSSSVQNMQVRDLDALTRDQVRVLKVGEYTKPIRIASGFVLFYVADKRLVGSQEFLRQKDSLERELHEREVLRQTDLWLQTERARTKIDLVKL